MRPSSTSSWVTLSLRTRAPSLLHLAGPASTPRPPSLPPTCSRLIDSEEDELIVRHVAFHYREEIDFSDLILHSAASIASCADSTARGSLIVALDDIRKARASSSRSSARISQDRAAQALAAAGEGAEAAAEAVAEAGAEAGDGAEGSGGGLGRNGGEVLGGGHLRDRGAGEGCL